MAYQIDYFYLDDLRITSNWTWQKGGPNFLCGLRNGSAVRITSKQVQADIDAFIASLRLPFAKNLYLGAQLRPSESPGWYWLRPTNTNDRDSDSNTTTTQNTSRQDDTLIETLYWNNGSSVGFTQWQVNGLPPTTQAYGTRRGVAYNITSGEWFTAHANEEYAVLCKWNEPTNPSASSDNKNEMQKWYLCFNIIGWILFGVATFLVLPLFFCCCCCKGNRKYVPSSPSAYSSSFTSVVKGDRVSSSGPLPSVRNPLQAPQQSLSLSSSSSNGANNSKSNRSNIKGDKKHKKDASKTNRYNNIDDTNSLQRHVSKKRMSNW